MDVDALLEAFQDFEKKAKMETCPVLEQFLCHVAKTGQPLILWSQLKQYFMFKLEKVMDDFHASTPEQRVSHNPNVEHVPFEEMKTRILKIVDGYNGVPFTIQRLCELVMDPNRNYAGTDKFLRGLEKNVRVVSCMYPTSEKNGASSVNRMNGVMFPGNSTPYSDSRNVNGPATPKPLNRPRLSLSTSLSTNGLPDGPVGKESEPEPTTEEVEEHHMSDPSQSEAEDSPSSGTKNKHPEEEGDTDDDKQEVKRLKFDEKEEEETENEKKESLCLQESENLSEMPDSLEVSRGQDNQSGTSCDSTCDQEPSSTGTETTEREGSSSETADVHTEEDESAVDGPEPPAPSSFEQDNEESNSGVCDGEDPASDKEVPSSSSSSTDLSTEGDADSSHSTDTAVEPGEQRD